MSDAEIAAQTRNTAAFIALDPTVIELQPQVETITPSGARTMTPGTARDPQTFKLIPMTFDQRPTTTPDGVERIIDYHLLGMPDALVEVNDIFFMDDFPNDYFLVVAVSDGHQYETKVLVERHLMKDGLQQVVP
jgi:hypothetical protein